MATKGTPGDPTQFKPGIHDHFRGGVYLAKQIAMFADGQDYVEYTAVKTGKNCGRYLWEWCEVVLWPDGEHRPRFVYRGPNLETPEPPFKVPKADG